MTLANPVKNVPNAINSSMISFIRLSFFFRFLLTCFSPPYVYIILYGVPYAKRLITISIFYADFSRKSDSTGTPGRTQSPGRTHTEAPRSALPCTPGIPCLCRIAPLCHRCSNRMSFRTIQKHLLL